jgi:hypothetical protein
MNTKEQLDASCIERWQKLTSETHWQQGEIIAIFAANDLWTRDGDFAHVVGGVTAAYVRALRIVWDRFSDIRANYPSLHWSHFYTAIEWNDAHVWLRRADIDRLSPSEMKRVRLFELVEIEKEKLAAMRRSSN